MAANPNVYQILTRRGHVTKEPLSGVKATIGVGKVTGGIASAEHIGMVLVARESWSRRVRSTGRFCRSGKVVVIVPWSLLLRQVTMRHTGKFDKSRQVKKENEWQVNTPPAKAGGFGLRLKAGLIGHPADDRRYTTVKSSSGSGGC